MTRLAMRPPGQRRQEDRLLNVLNASALLCLINGEPGSERVAAVLPLAVISAVNLAEVATKLNELGADADTARALLALL